MKLGALNIPFAQRACYGKLRKSSRQTNFLDVLLGATGVALWHHQGEHLYAIEIIRRDLLPARARSGGTYVQVNSTAGLLRGTTVHFPVL